MRRNLFAGVVGAFVVVTPVAAASGNVTFAPMVYASGDSEVIGSVKAGFVCLPSGNLRWGDMKLPRDSQLAEKAVAAFDKNQSALGLQTQTEYQFQGRVESVSLKLCVAGLGVGEKKPKGKGKISISWTQSVLPSGEMVKSAVISSDFDVDGYDPRRDSLPLEQALLDSFAMFLKAEGAK